MTIKIGILGASGYTGAELVRLLHNHPEAEIVALGADSKAGQPMAAVYPHLQHLDLPDLIKVEQFDFAALDFLFCCLPHATTQKILSTVAREFPDLPICDFSADFRLRNVQTYADWYGGAHQAVELQKSAVYGLPELYRAQIATANLVANTGCYPVSAILPLAPLLEAKLIAPQGLVIDSKTGTSGAGRALKQNLLFSEVYGGFSAYGVAAHRHSVEIEQELSVAAEEDLLVTFTPHLLPQVRGILSTIYVSPTADNDAESIRSALAARYADESFVTVLPKGQLADTRQVIGTNRCVISVTQDRVPGRVIIISAIDNLVKGASGQAIQNMNIRLGLREDLGLPTIAMVP